MLRIRIIGDEVLRQKAAEVTEFNSELKDLVDDMIDTMHDNDGIGLAAPQIGVSQRILVTDITEIDKNYGPIAFINPTIVASDGEISMEEGCLSIPNIRETVTRPQKIQLRYQDVDGKEHTEWFDDWMARVLQHEIDHLDGVLFTDYLSPVKQKLVFAEFQA